MGYDWQRIVAVEIDEPYNSLDYNSSATCQWDGATWDQINQIDQTLAARASELKSIAPAARFWVNFTDQQVIWMMGGGAPPDNDCPVPLNKPYIDVISVDHYYEAFDPGVEMYYDFFVQNPATPQQQVALIPGTFYRDGEDNPSTQASYFQGYFDYANNANRQCNLSLGRRGVTGSYDGCPVWIVMGFLSGKFNGRKYSLRGRTRLEVSPNNCY